MVTTGNIRMLSIYYSVQNMYKNDLAAPLLSAIRPLINVQEHSLSLLVEKLTPNLKFKVREDMLCKRLKESFRKIDSGVVKPTVFLGHTLETDEIVENSARHDTYKAIYTGFFDEISILRYDCAAKVKRMFVGEIMGYKGRLSEREKKMLKQAYSNFDKRPPLSLNVETIKDMVDIMHDCANCCCGPDIADSTLSTAVLNADRQSPNYKAQNFI